MKLKDFILFTVIVAFIYFVEELISVHGDIEIIEERNSYVWYLATIISCFVSAFLAQHFLNTHKFDGNIEESIYSILFYCIFGMIISSVNAIIILNFIEQEPSPVSYTFIFLNYFGYKIFEGALFELYRVRFSINRPR